MTKALLFNSSYAKGDLDISYITSRIAGTFASVNRENMLLILSRQRMAHGMQGMRMCLLTKERCPLGSRSLAQDVARGTCPFVQCISRPCRGLYQR